MAQKKWWHVHGMGRPTLATSARKWLGFSSRKTWLPSWQVRCSKRMPAVGQGFMNSATNQRQFAFVLQSPSKTLQCLMPSGCYSVTGSENLPCLIYVTFSNKVVIYYNITLGEVGFSNLIETMKEKEGVQELLNYFNVDGRKTTPVGCTFSFSPWGTNAFGA